MNIQNTYFGLATNFDMNVLDTYFGLATNIDTNSKCSQFRFEDINASFYKQRFFSTQPQ